MAAPLLELILDWLGDPEVYNEVLAMVEKETGDDDE